MAYQRWHVILVGLLQSHNSGWNDENNSSDSPAQQFLEPLVASLLLVAMPGAPSSFLFLVVRPGAPSSVLAPSPQANSFNRWKAFQGPCPNGNVVCRKNGVCLFASYIHWQKNLQNLKEIRGGEIVVQAPGEAAQDLQLFVRLWVAPFSTIQACSSLWLHAQSQLIDVVLVQLGKGSRVIARKSPLCSSWQSLLTSKLHETASIRGTNIPYCGLERAQDFQKAPSSSLTTASGPSQASDFLPLAQTFSVKGWIYKRVCASLWFHEASHPRVLTIGVSLFETYCPCLPYARCPYESNARVRQPASSSPCSSSASGSSSF